MIRAVVDRAHFGIGRWKARLLSIHSGGDDDAPSKEIHWDARSAYCWNGGALHRRGGSGSGAMQTNPGSLSRRGLCAGSGQARRWITDPLYRSHHAGKASTADGAQAIAESQPTTGGELQGKQSKVRAAALTGSACATAAGSLAIVGTCVSRRQSARCCR